jgi:hypothetical protein
LSSTKDFERCGKDMHVVGKKNLFIFYRIGWLQFWGLERNIIHNTYSGGGIVLPFWHFVTNINWPLYVLMYISLQKCDYKNFWYVKLNWGAKLWHLNCYNLLFNVLMGLIMPLSRYMLGMKYSPKVYIIIW